MHRRRPAKRLIDGPPDQRGKRLWRRVVTLMVPAVVLANVAGALVVAVLALFVVPTPEVPDAGRARLVNLVAAAVYVVLASVVGSVWAIRRFGRHRNWLVEERAPSERERRLALRAPLRLATVTGCLWLLGVALFVAINAPTSLLLAVTVGATVGLGGVTTCAVTYIVSERITRPIMARALASGVPERPLLPGVVTRAILTWVLGSAVPVAGLVLVAIAVLTGRDVANTELAVTILGLGGVALIVGLLVTYQSARAIADPVLSVREALKRVETGDFSTGVPVYDGSELGLLQAGFNRMEAGLREREEVRDLFGRHVGEEVARAALDRGIELGGEERDVAVLFVDLVGSTRLAAERPPQAVVELLNSFFAVVVDAVERRGGWINKFEGDAALAVFGAPIEREDAAGCALAAARELGARLRDELPEIDAGIGVAAGRAVAGNIGAERRFEYTVIGDPVNEGARLCELAKTHDGRVLASGATVERAGDDEAGRWRTGDAVTLRGRAGETVLAHPA